MKKGLTLIGGMGLGAGLMYMLDPDFGRRRRALVRDKVVHTLHKTTDAIDATSRDLRNRTLGLIAEVRSLLEGEEVPDDVLAARVRSKIGGVISHPSSIEVTADQGRVTLRGPILARELDRLISRVSSVRGVTGVENQLEAHEKADDVPGLQGGVERRGERFELMQTNWSPAARLLAGAAGGALAVYGARQRGVLGTTLSTVGLGILARGLTNIEMKRLLGVGGGRNAVDIQKTINIAAPVERVFEFWTDYKNFPRFMTNVREVIDTGGGRSHWVVAGPAGAPVEWDAVITKLVPNQRLAWKSVPGATIGHSGIIRFDPNPDGTTRIDIKMSYNPPAGALGHGLAMLFGADPKSQMDEDLMRMKSLIETRIPTHDAAHSSSTGRETYTH